MSLMKDIKEIILELPKIVIWYYFRYTKYTHKYYQDITQVVRNNIHGGKENKKKLLGTPHQYDIKIMEVFMIGVMDSKGLK